MKNDTMTMKQARTALQEIGYTIKKEDGEYRVNLSGGNEATAYYTEDLNDAVNTAQFEARRTAASRLSKRHLAAASRTSFDVDESVTVVWPKHEGDHAEGIVALCDGRTLWVRFKPYTDDEVTCKFKRHADGWAPDDLPGVRVQIVG
jgi:hypothetical protein